MSTTQTLFRGTSFITADQLDKKAIQILFARARKLEKMPYSQTKKYLEGKVVTMLFFEPSSRTFSSFATSVKKLGGMTIEYQNPLQTSSAVKGETLEDTVRVFENYSDAIVMRHFEKGALARAHAAVHIPVINAGDGIGEHPTQALLDSYTIFKKKKRLDHLKGVVVGDLLNGRTVHSLFKTLSLYAGNVLYLLSPKELDLEKGFMADMEKRGLRLIQIRDTKDIPGDCDFWYWTRVQKERFTSKKRYEKLKHAFVLTKKLLDTKGNKGLILLHPLPRVGEIETVIDQDPRALYLTGEVRSGLIIRMALLSLILSRHA